MELRLYRDILKPDCTLGKLTVNDQVTFYTVEDVVREIKGKPVIEWKVHGKTAIPEGRYKVELTYSPHFGKILPLLIDVPGFSGVRVHSGNTAADTEGCLIVGLERTESGVVKSQKAMDVLLTMISDADTDGEEIWITVGV